MEKIRDQEIIGLILGNKTLSISEIQNRFSEKISIPTLNRDLARLKKSEIVTEVGKGPQLKYIVNLKNLATIKIDPDQFFRTELDDRIILERFNIDVFEKFKEISVFSEDELLHLDHLNLQFRSKTTQLSESQFRKEFERLMIELSWKSSQIEGNTYDLLDTEQLLKYNFVSDKNTEEETMMLLNHKTAIEYTYQNRD